MHILNIVHKEHLQTNHCVIRLQVNHSFLNISQRKAHTYDWVNLSVVSCGLSYGLVKGGHIVSKRHRNTDFAIKR